MSNQKIIFFCEEIPPTTQPKPPLVQPEAVSSCPVAGYLGEEADPYLATTSPKPPLLRAKSNLQCCDWCWLQKEVGTERMKHGASKAWGGGTRRSQPGRAAPLAFRWSGGFGRALSSWGRAASRRRRAPHWPWPFTMWCQEPGLALCRPLLALEKGLWWAPSNTDLQVLLASSPHSL